jgi:TP901 family phage tail tape measure protein
VDKDLHNILDRIKGNNVAQKTLNSLGISIFDGDGKMRSLEDILTELSRAWNKLDDENDRILKVSITRNIAGIQKSNQLIDFLEKNNK